eukprot:Amastigsp_a844249_36.p2 type:complete len:156 gc:universal Amastigsp_a844249_36:572-1039(+)
MQRRFARPENAQRQRLGSEALSLPADRARLAGRVARHPHKMALEPEHVRAHRRHGVELGDTGVPVDTAANALFLLAEGDVRRRHKALRVMRKVRKYKIKRSRRVADRQGGEATLRSKVKDLRKDNIERAEARRDKRNRNRACKNRKKNSAWRGRA